MGEGCRHPAKGLSDNAPRDLNIPTAILGLVTVAIVWIMVQSINRNQGKKICLMYVTDEQVMQAFFKFFFFFIFRCLYCDKGQRHLLERRNLKKLTIIYGSSLNVFDRVIGSLYLFLQSRYFGHSINIRWMVIWTEQEGQIKGVFLF